MSKPSSSEQVTAAPPAESATLSVTDGAPPAPAAVTPIPRFETYTSF